MKLSLFALLSSSVALCGSAAYAQPLTVEELLSRWMHAYNSADVDTLTELYADDAELYVHNVAEFVGQRAIGAYWAIDLGVESPITELVVTETSSDEKSIIAQGKYRVLDRETQTLLAEGRFSHLWTLESVGWVLKRDAWMDDRFVSAHRSPFRS